MRFSELMPPMGAPLALIALLSLTACGEKGKYDASSDVAMAADSLSARQLGDSVNPVELIPPVAPPLVESPASVTPVPVEAPKRKPVVAKMPVNPRASPTSAEPTRTSGIIESGTTFGVSSGSKVCSNTLAVGDRITTTTNSAISASNGVSIPAGARIGLVVSRSRTSGRQGDEAALAFDVRNVTFGGDTYTMTGDVSTDAVVTERKGGDGKKVAIGAAAGAIIGNIIGGGNRATRTVVGAAAGGAAGAATAAMTGDRFACLPEGSSLTVKLGSPLTVKN